MTIEELEDKILCGDFDEYTLDRYRLSVCNNQKKIDINKACNWLYAMLSPIHPIIMQDEKYEHMLWKRSTGELVEMFRKAMNK